MTVPSSHAHARAGPPARGRPASARPPDRRPVFPLRRQRGRRPAQRSRPRPLLEGAEETTAWHLRAAAVRPRPRARRRADRGLGRCPRLLLDWWLEPAHRVGWVGLVVNSLLLGYVTVIPVYFLILANRLREVDPRIAVPSLRVAFVVTRAPSEDWAMARTTLNGHARPAVPARLRRVALRRGTDRGDPQLVPRRRHTRVQPQRRSGLPTSHVAAPDTVQRGQPRLLLRQLGLCGV